LKIHGLRYCRQRHEPPHILKRRFPSDLACTYPMIQPTAMWNVDGFETARQSCITPLQIMHAALNRGDANHPMVTQDGTLKIEDTAVGSSSLYCRSIHWYCLDLIETFPTTLPGLDVYYSPCRYCHASIGDRAIPRGNSSLCRSMYRPLFCGPAALIPGEAFHLA